MLDDIIYGFGWGFIICIISLIAAIAHKHIEEMINNQKKIKLLCKHEYEANSAFYCKDNVEYEFKCRKCGKRISIRAISRDKFKWIGEENIDDEGRKVNC